MLDTFNKRAPSNSQEPQPKNFGDETPEQRARHRETAIDRTRQCRKRPRPNVCVLMLRDLRKFFCDRYDKFGPAMPEGCDAALDDFLILLNYVAMLGDYRALRTAKERWMPWLGEATFDAMVAQVVHSPLYLSPDALGIRIGLYDAKRTELKIKTIGAVDFNKMQRAERRKAMNTANRKAKRAAVRALCPAKVPASKTKPWLAFGRSRSWWHANGKPQPLEIGQNLSAVSLESYVADTNCPTGASSPLKGGDLTRSDSGGEADTAAAGLMLSPALNTDIPDNKSAPTKRRLIRACVEDKDRDDTLALAAASLPIRLPVANGTDVTLIDRAGQAAHRPDETRPHQRGSTMSRIQSRDEMFSKIKRVYPPKFQGNDDALNFEALGIALDHGADFMELMYEASQLPIDGVEAPSLTEFLVSRCWVERAAA